MSLTHEQLFTEGLRFTWFLSTYSTPGAGLEAEDTNIVPDMRTLSRLVGRQPIRISPSPVAWLPPISEWALGGPWAKSFWPALEERLWMTTESELGCFFFFSFYLSWSFPGLLRNCLKYTFVSSWGRKSGWGENPWAALRLPKRKARASSANCPQEAMGASLWPFT